MKKNEVKNERKQKKLYLVIPCYNEEEVINITTEALTLKMNKLIKDKKISKESKVLYVNDGSKDNTWKLIEEIHNKNNMFCGVKLSRNRGHQNALLAGLMTAKKYADITISMDADLQDDINVIDSMLEEYEKGSEIVYGVRSSRKKDTFFKKFTAEGFYKFMKLMGVEIVFNHADCRLMSKLALDGLEQFEEVNLFLRGIVPQIGYQTSVAYYERNERAAGESKYPLKKMLKFAMEGITSFSVKPLKMITTIGFLMSIFSFIVLIYAIVVKIMGDVVSGWTFIIVSIWMVAGIQMLSLGVIGEYIGKIYNETKKRPKYIIEKELF